ncbi:MAG: hypothetical protein EVA21_04050 [Alphaproteobacteria bacterium]|nr:MAG: hypothetical protein EVA21_04050 [Alphaproteobacteria bacterium]
MNFFDELSFSYLEYKINNSYTNRLLKYGNSPEGLFWKNSFTQIHRFELIITALNRYYNLKKFTICDIGCGYGKLFEFLTDKLNKSTFQYQGCDLNGKLIDHCTKRFMNKNCKFYKNSLPKGIVDFSVMSGTFNLSVTDDIKIWEKYILKNLTNIWKRTNKIMTFNLLHQNEKKINQGLYYTNKNWIKNTCEQRFGQTEIIFSSILPDDILVIVKT